MGSLTPTGSSAPFARLAGVGLIIFLANAAMLVLQMVAGRLLSPFIGSSLETWTSVIGVFLTGIALGNALGGKLADRYPTPRTLAILLGIGALTALWMVAFPMLLASTEFYKSIPLGPRIPVLAFILCLPAGFVLSLLTPLAIKLGLPDVSHTGRVAGMIFALSTLGCLLGNYLTGFVLMKTFTINTLVFLSAGGLAVLAVMTMVILKQTPDAAPGGTAATAVADTPESPGTNPHAFADIRIAYLIVFLASFGGMTLELTASRVLAEHLGVSLFTWTGIIGVMLAGTALGNFTGGIVADRANRSGSGWKPRSILACTLLVAGAGTVFLLVTTVLVQRYAWFDGMDPISQVMAWTFSLFFLPMFALGMVSPQVIRLAVPDVAHVGRIAGRVYAWSTGGAIVGTFAAGYVLLSTLGMHQTLLAVALVLTVTSLVVAKVWDDNTLLYIFSIVLGGVTGGFILINRSGQDADLVVKLESNYYTIKVTREEEYVRDEAGAIVTMPDGRALMRPTNFLVLTLDHLIHSSVNPDEPDRLHYSHEYVQVEFLRGARAKNPNPRVLVIGGGGYTYPRYAMEILPETRLDVVEIDPGVTKVAKEHLGLKDYKGMHIEHMDGRQFIAEKVPPGTYDLVIQDAVNDLSVPSHLLTKEYNDAVKRALKPDGVYLLTVIDAIEYGQLWKAAMHTLRQTYPTGNVTLLGADRYGRDGSDHFSVENRAVYVIYAADKPVDLPALQQEVWKQTWAPNPATVASIAATVANGPGGAAHGLVAAHEVFRKAPQLHTYEAPVEKIQPFLDAEPRIILTDQYAPVDNLMADVFRYRYRNRPR